MKLNRNKNNYFDIKRKRKEAFAHLHDYRISARKVRTVADMIRGESVPLAMNYLIFQARPASKIIRSLLLSAISNAKIKGLNVNYLFVAKIIINHGSIMKRFISRAHGKATKIRKRTSHITITLQQF